MGKKSKFDLDLNIDLKEADIEENLQGLQFSGHEQKVQKTRENREMKELIARCAKIKDAKGRV